MNRILRLAVLVVSVLFFVISVNFDTQAQESIRRSYSDLAWSPDGTKVAFLYNPYFDSDDSWVRPSNARSESDIMVANSDGTDIRRLTSHNIDSDLIWSPDNNLIAFRRLTYAGIETASGIQQWYETLAVIDLQGNLLPTMALDDECHRRVNVGKPIFWLNSSQIVYDLSATSLTPASCLHEQTTIWDVQTGVVTDFIQVEIDTESRYRFFRYPGYSQTFYVARANRCNGFGAVYRTREINDYLYEHTQEWGANQGLVTSMMMENIEWRIPPVVSPDGTRMVSLGLHPVWEPTESDYVYIVIRMLSGGEQDWYPVYGNPYVEPYNLRWIPTGDQIMFDLWVSPPVNDSYFMYEDMTARSGCQILLMDMEGNFSEFPFEDWSPEE